MELAYLRRRLGFMLEHMADKQGGEASQAT